MSITRLIQKQEDPASRLETLINQAEPRIRDSFLRAVQSVRSQRSLTELIRLLEAGQLEEALDLIEEIPALLATQVSFTLVTSGEDTAELIARVLNRPVSFDQTNTRAVNIMQNNRLRLIREFSTEQRNATRQALVDGIARGMNPRQQARAFRDSIGLTTRQLQAVQRYRSLLEMNSRQVLDRQLRDRRFDRTVQRAIDTDTPLTTQQIDRMVERYQERYLRYRSEVIARTEALRSVHQGSEEMYQQAFDAGTLDPGALVRTWVTARDTRVRDSHNGMNRQQRAFGETFTSDNGIPLRYPGDENAPASETVQCRCVLTTRFL